MRSIHYTLSAALNRAVKQGLIRDNPCTTVEAPRHTPKEAQVMDPGDAAPVP